MHFPPKPLCIADVCLNAEEINHAVLGAFWPNWRCRFLVLPSATLSMKTASACEGMKHAIGFHSSKCPCNRIDLYCFEIMLHAVTVVLWLWNTFTIFSALSQEVPPVFIFKTFYFSELIAGRLCVASVDLSFLIPSFKRLHCGQLDLTNPHACLHQLSSAKVP